MPETIRVTAESLPPTYPHPDTQRGVRLFIQDGDNLLYKEDCVSPLQAARRFSRNEMMFACLQSTLVGTKLGALPLVTGIALSSLYDQIDANLLTPESALAKGLILITVSFVTSILLRKLANDVGSAAEEDRLKREAILQFIGPKY